MFLKVIQNIYRILKFFHKVPYRKFHQNLYLNVLFVNVAILTVETRICGALALLFPGVLVLLSEISARICGSGVFDFASGDFALREKNLHMQKISNLKIKC